MSYKRKTQDVFSIQGDYGCGWEEVTQELKYSEAKQRLAEYRANEPNRFRSIRKREKINQN